jgi:site-specific DNA-cytosine methylase
MRQLGNAVPVQLAEVIARPLMKILEKPEAQQPTALRRKR